MSPPRSTPTTRRARTTTKKRKSPESRPGPRPTASRGSRSPRGRIAARTPRRLRAMIPNTNHPRDTGGALAPEGAGNMPQSHFRRTIRLALAAAITVTAAGCERSSEKKAGRSAQPVMRVEVVQPERHTVQRTVGEPGQLEAYETTPIHAKIAGYVKDWTVNIGAEIKKGQVLAELWVPEVEADLQQKRAAVEQAVARRAQAEAAVKVAQAAVTSAEVRAGIARADADLTRWQLEYRRVEQLLQERAMTGTLVDETRNKLKSAEAARDEVRARVKSAEAALSEARCITRLARRCETS